MFDTIRRVGAGEMENQAGTLSRDKCAYSSCLMKGYTRHEVQCALQDKEMFLLITWWCVPLPYGKILELENQLTKHRLDVGSTVQRFMGSFIPVM
ncbi:unnamed protein product [Clonostachys solani]|uniref:Uncharacterized protein n=1 Tax=Clonostachys solani TaxID=160281 RepID=A0A9N9W9X4_9HYPO|nr:unnamed protein product [Clonostachys solani]